MTNHRDLRITGRDLAKIVGKTVACICPRSGIVAIRFEDNTWIYGGTGESLGDREIDWYEHPDDHVLRDLGVIDHETYADIQAKDKARRLEMARALIAQAESEAT